MTRILVVEDQEDLAFALQRAFENEGFDVVVTLDGPSGLAAATSGDIALVVLDLMLPGLDGYRVLRQLRQVDPELPVLVLTARGEEVDKVQAFGIGADDYVTKPFGTMELIARIRALLRRAGPRPGETPTAVERFGEIEVNPASRTVYRTGLPVALRPREFELLLALLRRRGAVASRHDLLREVWGYGAEVMSRTVDIHIAELRRKLETDPAAPRHLLTVWKVGYRLER